MDESSRTFWLWMVIDPLHSHEYSIRYFHEYPIRITMRSHEIRWTSWKIHDLLTCGDFASWIPQGGRTPWNWHCSGRSHWGWSSARSHEVTWRFLEISRGPGDVRRFQEIKCWRFLVNGDVFLDSNGDPFLMVNGDIFFWEVLENEWGKFSYGIQKRRKSDGDSWGIVGRFFVLSPTVFDFYGVWTIQYQARTCDFSSPFLGNFFRIRCTSLMVALSRKVSVAVAFILVKCCSGTFFLFATPCFIWCGTAFIWY